MSPRCWTLSLKSENLNCKSWATLIKNRKKNIRNKHWHYCGIRFFVIDVWVTYSKVRSAVLDLIRCKSGWAQYVETAMHSKLFLKNCAFPVFKDKFEKIKVSQLTLESMSRLFGHSLQIVSFTWRVHSGDLHIFPILCSSYQCLYFYYLFRRSSLPSILWVISFPTGEKLLLYRYFHGMYSD